MVLSKNDPEFDQDLTSQLVLTPAKKRRIRRKKLQARLNAEKSVNYINDIGTKKREDEPVIQLKLHSKLACDATNLNLSYSKNDLSEETEIPSISDTMSTSNSLKCKGATGIQQTKSQIKSCKASTEKHSKMINNKTNSQDIVQAQDVSKAIQESSKSENKDSEESFGTESKSTKQVNIGENKVIDLTLSEEQIHSSQQQNSSEKKSDEKILIKNSNNPHVKSKDEVDKANTDLKTEAIEKSREQIKADREAKKLLKQAKKKGEKEINVENTAVKKVTNKEVVETLASIVEVVIDVQEVVSKVSALAVDDKTKQIVQDGEQQQSKSKAELRAERRAKQEAQRAAKSGILPSSQIKVGKGKTETTAKPDNGLQKSLSTSVNKNKKSAIVKQTKTKSQHASFRVDWFEHLYPKVFENPLNNVPLNSELHPAIVKLGVQLNTGVVFGSNARCVALLNSMKHVISDYKVPDKTEFARGLESYLTTNANFLWTMREPNAAQTNAMNFLRFHLTDLIKKNIEDDEKNSQAKKLLLGEIDKYIGDQIDKAGEAISLTVRDKISNGDTILTYGCSSLIEKILCDAWEAGVSFHAVVAGSREAAAGREMLRRLATRSHPVTYIDITALSFAMRTVDKVIVGASSVLMNGAVLGAAGTLQVALVARAHNVPLLVCCETHKFSDKVLTDAFVYNELGDPQDLVDDKSPLKDWRSRVNLNVLNLMYDVTPANLVTAVVTELDILPCTSAPVVHRIKLTNN